VIARGVDGVAVASAEEEEEEAAVAVEADPLADRDRREIEKGTEAVVGVGAAVAESAGRKGTRREERGRRGDCRPFGRDISAVRREI
jgi:hypothetical protein